MTDPGFTARVIKDDVFGCRWLVEGHGHSVVAASIEKGQEEIRKKIERRPPDA